MSAIYDQRIKEVGDIYKAILATPFTFTKDEMTISDGEKLQYVSTKEGLTERWRKKMKLYTLERYVDLLDLREKNKDQKDFVIKTDAELEKDARAKVLKIMNETYQRIQKTYKENNHYVDPSGW